MMRNAQSVIIPAEARLRRIRPLKGLDWRIFCIKLKTRLGLAVCYTLH